MLTMRPCPSPSPRFPSSSCHTPSPNRSSPILRHRSLSGPASDSITGRSTATPPVLSLNVNPPSENSALDQALTRSPLGEQRGGRMEGCQTSPRSGLKIQLPLLPAALRLPSEDEPGTGSNAMQTFCDSSFTSSSGSSSSGSTVCVPTHDPAGATFGLGTSGMMTTLGREGGGWRAEKRKATPYPRQEGSGYFDQGGSSAGEEGDEAEECADGDGEE